jgi:hypothetical protein
MKNTTYNRQKIYGEKYGIKMGDVFEIPNSMGGIFACKVINIYDNTIDFNVQNKGWEKTCFHKTPEQVKEYKRVG